MEMHVFIYNEIGMFGVSAEDIRDQIEKNPDADEIVVHISSPGGQVFEGWTIGNILKNSGKKITVLIEGLCASIATYIALQGDKIFMADAARFIIHNPMQGVEGDEGDLKSAAEQLATIKADLIKTYKLKTGLPESELSIMMDEETSFTTDESIAKGFVDEKMEPAKAVAKIDINKIKNMKDETKLDKIGKQMNDLIDKMGNFLSPKDVKNVVVELADGVKIFVVSEDGELEGKEAFIADEEGNATEDIAPAGTHEMTDGRSIVINDQGIVESVSEAADDKHDDEEKGSLKNKIKELEASMVTSDTDKEKLTNELQESKDAVKSMETEMKKIQATIVGGEPIVARVNGTPTNRTQTQVDNSGVGRLLEKIKNRY